MLRLEALRKQIAGKKVLPCYLFFGEEEHLKDRAVRAVSRLFLGADHAGPGPEVVYASEIDGAEIVSRAQSISMFAQRILLVVREADALSAKSRSAVLSYLAAPNPDACLVLSTVKTDPKMALVKQFDGPAAVVQFKAMTGGEAADWARKEAAGRGLRLSCDAAQLLTELAGTDLGVISAEIDKLCLLSVPGGGQEIGIPEVRELAALNPQYGEYELTTALSRGQRREALALYQTMLAAGEDPGRILASIGYEVLRLWRIAAADGGPAEVSRRTGIHEFVVRQLQPSARRRPAHWYPAALGQVFRAEFRLKTGHGQPAPLVQELIFRLTAQSLQRA